MIRINLYATLRLIAGQKTLLLELSEGETIINVIHAIALSNPLLKKQLFDEENMLLEHVHVFCNGADVFSLPQGLNTPTRTDDTLDLFPSVSGGCSPK
ncbi:MAG: MoaD/ThiS family protein [Anaerolineaceae bacterium]|nr:MoaD/ThiS family protein [Anaerolineaceae bacterium]